MSLCILAGAGMIKIAADVFMLGWTHSVEKTRWEEDWRVGENGLKLTQARIEGMGAGMETPPDAVFDGVWWRWRPKMPALPEVLLRRSDAVPEGWRLCAAGTCMRVADAAETKDIVALRPCK